MDSDLQFFNPNVSQAYVQSKTSTQRPIFVCRPKGLPIRHHNLLRAEKPLHGISKASIHWYRTSHNHHQRKLSLIPEMHDPCFLYVKNGMSCTLCLVLTSHGFTCLQTDDTSNAGNNEFMVLKSKVASRFDCKLIKVLQDV